jgi:hypothetical protein
MKNTEIGMFAPYDVKTLGCFVEKSHGKTFEYALNDEVILSVLAHGGKNVRFPHKIFVGPNADQRYAFVKGTVAHVIVDETDFGWIVEKWNIKNHKNYAI